MIIEVYFTGDSFVAYDPYGKQIKDRAILEQISFDQMPGFKTSFYLKVDKSQNPVIMNDIKINIDTQHT